MAFKISLYRHRSDRTVDVCCTNICKQKQTGDTVLYSIHIEVVPLNEEKRKKKEEEKIKGENKHASVETKPELLQ